mmetsp:Transcript_12242/g.16010  ORF Transcript_12242/g.16010 Transcript_12242/m.16010 type:complete len:133 (+) Transcript_12242:72-470(+)
MSGKAAKKVETKGAPKKAGGGDGGKKRGWDDIEKIFGDKKAQQINDEKKEMERKQQYKRKSAKLSKSGGSNVADTSKSPSEWVNDGLGGVYNPEGFTGRVEDGVKVFKSHILRKPNSGNTAQCPFDCDCCFI